MEKNSLVHTRELEVGIKRNSVAKTREMEKKNSLVNREIEMGIKRNSAVQD
jgi:hypothetical protein